MDLPPRQPDKAKNSSESQNKPREAREQRWQQILSRSPAHASATVSWGERLLPGILAAMEACWVDAILIGLVGIGLFQSQDPLIPLWVPFVLIIGSGLLSSYLERRAASTASVSNQNDNTPTANAGTPLVIMLVGVTTLLIIWVRIYAQTAFVLDPHWLLSLSNDILLLNANAYLVVAILGACVYFYWRGVRLAHRDIEHPYVFRAMRLGLLIMLAVVVIRAGQASTGQVFYDEPTLFLLIPVFLILSLAAQALARAVSVRRSHPVGLQGSISAQERALLLIIGAFSLLILLVALAVGSIVSPTFLQRVEIPLGIAYDWFVVAFAHIVVFLVTPLFWLIAWFMASHSPRHPTVRNVRTGVSRVPFHKPPGGPDLLLILIPILEIVLPILLALLLLALIWRILRRRRRTVVARRNEDVYESVWSWSLFWKQLKAFLRAFFARFFPHRAAKVEGQTVSEAIESGPGVRSIREIYRVLLKRAAGRGYPRKKDETPYEFRQRLDEQTPLAEPHLELITEVYTATRYGGSEPDETEVARVRGAWAEVEQQWNKEV